VTQSNIDFYAKRRFEDVGPTDFDGHMLTGMVPTPVDDRLPETRTPLASQIRQSVAETPKPPGDQTMTSDVR
jgi:hypothetical protein